MSEGKSLDEIRFELGLRRQKVSRLERQEDEAIRRAEAERIEELRQRPIEGVMEEAYEANEKVDRILARRKTRLEAIRNAEAKGIWPGNNIFDMCVNDKCFAAYPEFGLAALSYRRIVGRRQGK